MQSKTLDRGKSSGKSSGNSGYDFSDKNERKISNENDFNKSYNRNYEKNNYGKNNYEKNNYEKNNYEKNIIEKNSGSGDMRSRVYVYGPKGDHSDSVEGEVVESQILELDREIGDTIIFMTLL